MDAVVYDCKTHKADRRTLTVAEEKVRRAESAAAAALPDPPMVAAQPVGLDDLLARVERLEEALKVKVK